MPNNISAGDTAWLLASAALVMLMTPALGFFYGGLVRRKNVLATIMHSFFILCLISVQWVLWGYTLAFGPDQGGIIGGLDWLALRGVGQDAGPYAPTVPHEAYMVFQMMFAVITPALITGAFAERKRFKAFVVFTLLWATFVYDPVALVAALVLGRRVGYGREALEPHDATMTVLGASLLWFGWFGFNAGSAITAGGLAANAFVVTNTAAAMAALTWMTVSWLHKGAPSVLGAAAGAVAGLVAITPASGYVDVSASILIGLGAGVFCYTAIQLTKRLKVDDALDVFGVHGIGGAWGALATGIFATVAINSGAKDGLLYGNPGQLGIQAIAVAASIIYSAVMTFVILKLIDVFVGLRVPESEEVLGLDASQHREAAYQI
jgi:Amt family ammonium transporter